jgi:transposase
MRRSTTSINEITFAGIDYHKRSITVALGDREGNVITVKKLLNDTKTIREFFKNYSNLTCAIETCRGFEWLLELLEELGIKVVVCHARKVKLITETSFKNDKKDAELLLELLARNFLPTVHFPSAEQQQLKETLRWRIHLMKVSTRLKLRIHAFLDKENKGIEDPFTVKGMEYLRSVELKPIRRALLDKHLELLEVIEQRLSIESKTIKKLFNKAPKAKLLEQIPGIGVITAVTLLAEIGDINRFKRAEQLSKYFGLVPSEDSSGGKRKLGPITKEGNRMVRWLLIQDAWTAVRTSYGFRAIFNRIAFRQGKHKAIVAIARRLAEIVFNVLKHGHSFSEERLTNGSARCAPYPR